MTDEIKTPDVVESPQSTPEVTKEVTKEVTTEVQTPAPDHTKEINDLLSKIKTLEGQFADVEKKLEVAEKKVSPEQSPETNAAPPLVSKTIKNQPAQQKLSESEFIKRFSPKNDPYSDFDKLKNILGQQMEL